MEGNLGKQSFNHRATAAEMCRVALFPKVPSPGQSPVIGGPKIGFSRTYFPHTMGQRTQCTHNIHGLVTYIDCLDLLLQEVSWHGKHRPPRTVRSCMFVVPQPSMRQTIGNGGGGGWGLQDEWSPFVGNRLMVRCDVEFRMHSMHCYLCWPPR